jgi:hypothetical protein
MADTYIESWVVKRPSLRGHRCLSVVTFLGMLHGCCHQIRYLLSSRAGPAHYEFYKAQCAKNGIPENEAAVPQEHKNKEYVYIIFS